MATTLTSLETQARRYLLETTASFWSSAELVDIMNKAIKDLWRDIVDLKQEHFLTIDATNVTLSADTSTLSGVPAGVHKVYYIEPRDLTDTSSNKGLHFERVELNSEDFRAARGAADTDPSNTVIYYAVIGEGAPVAAPTIRVAPQASSAVNLTLGYVPVIANKVAGDDNPIPGESDNAVIAWTVAFARSKEREDRSPDPNWLVIYATEKQHLLQSLGLRDYSKPEYVDAVFKQYWS